MRKLTAAAVIAALMGCTNTADTTNETQQAQTPLERLRAGDTTLCADNDMTLSVAMVFATRLNLTDEFNKMSTRHENLEFTDISSKGFDEKIPELSCSGNIVLNAAWLGNRKFMIGWKIRPNLSDKGNVLIETEFDGDAEAFAAAFAYTMLAKYGPNANQAESEATDEQPNELTTENVVANDVTAIDESQFEGESADEAVERAARAVEQAEEAVRQAEQDQ